MHGNPSLPFSEADIEAQAKGSRKRRDITLKDTDKKTVLTGEVKLPYAHDGQSPLNEVVIADARKKAKKAHAKYFFTWNVNEFMLWETEPPEDVLAGHCYMSWQVTDVHTESQLDQSVTERQVRDWLQKFLYQFKQILSGDSKIGAKSPDVIFIETIESFLKQPILDTHAALLQLYKQKNFKKLIDSWMKTDLGWVVSDDPEDIRDQLDRAAKFACYSLVVKLVFHEALLNRHGEQMHRLEIPDRVKTSEELRLHLISYFRQAIKATGDYETVFGEDHTAFGDTIPFKADKAVSHWRGLIEQLHRYDFSKMDHEIIGNIFEQLISPEERKKFGQYYTSVEVVDLINSFCIPTGREKVLDPSCGGGTFLVRAYARKREKRPERPHEVRLQDLFGIDIERFAAHLSTINMATRDLIGAENYPQILRSDFFDVSPKKKFMQLPVHAGENGTGELEHREVFIQELDAIVTNPPYIRQEGIAKDKKQAYGSLIKQEQGFLPSGRSDIHVYFWPHAASFLREGGRLGFITSSQWLDVEYGFKLQRWMLENFRVIAVIESIDEPWFVGARVATTVTILERESDPEKRMANNIRFVQLRRPIREVMAHDGSLVEALRAADTLRDELLGLTENHVDERFRARLINQGDLWNDGVRLGVLMGKTDPDPDELGQSEDSSIQAGEYYGGKWGVYVRAPDLWFELLDQFGDKLVPLGEILSIHRGVTSGKDEFFFPADCSAEMLGEEQDAGEFKQRFGVPRADVKTGKIKLVRCGKGRKQIRPIEVEYIEPEVHSLMEIDGFIVQQENCSRSILLIKTQPRSKLSKYARQYIEWGEAEGYQDGSTCASRATSEREWFDLTTCERFSVIIPKIQQYKLVTVLNPNKLYQNCSLLGFSEPESCETKHIAGVLNSTWAILSRIQYARILGNEGNIQLDVFAAYMMLVPDPRQAPKKILRRIEKAFAKLAKRPAMQFLSEQRMRRMAFMQNGKEHKLADLSDQCELDMPDRRELDDAVLELMGVDDAEERADLIERLYGYLRWFFEETRQKEEQAIANKKRTAHRGQASPADIAKQVLQEVKDHHGWMQKQYDRDFLREIMPDVDIIELPHDVVPGEVEETLQGFRVTFKQGRVKSAMIYESTCRAKTELVKLLVEKGFNGHTRIPYEEDDAVKLLKDYTDFLNRRDTKLIELVQERTIDEERQEKILAALMRMAFRE